ncbi:hypothetical protein BDW75DRAFT_206188 [Aspergillus navahoensis]
MVLGGWSFLTHGWEIGVYVWMNCAVLRAAIALDLCHHLKKVSTLATEVMIYPQDSGYSQSNDGLNGACWRVGG